MRILILKRPFPQYYENRYTSSPKPFPHMQPNKIEKSVIDRLPLASSIYWLDSINALSKTTHHSNYSLVVDLLIYSQPQ
jgi:hypothetical protein